MYLKELELFNYGPFKGLNKITFSGQPEVIFVSAFYEDNSAMSNNAGKSSFIESVGYLLFGETRDNQKEIDLIHNDESQMYVSGIIVVEGTEIKIKRGRTKDNKPILEIEGLKGSKAAREKELQDRIGFSPVDFFNTFFCSQNKIHGFMESSPTERKKLIQKWLKLEVWSTYEERAKKKLKSVEDELRGLDATVVSIKVQMESCQKQQVDVSNLNTELDRLRQYQSSVALKLANLNIEMEKFSNVEQIQETLTKAVNLLNTLKTQKMKQERERASIVAKLQQAQLSKSQLESLQKLSLPDITSLEKEIEKTTKLTEQLISQGLQYSHEKQRSEQLLSCMSGFNGICPVDQRLCDKGTRISDFKTELTTTLVRVSGELTRIGNEQQDNYLKIKNIRAEVDNTRNIISKKDKLIGESNTDALDSLLSQIDETIVLYSAQELGINESITQLQQQLALGSRQDLKQQIADLAKVQQTTEAEIGLIQRTLGQQDQLLQQIVDFKNQLQTYSDKLTFMLKEKYKWLYMTFIFGKDGIPSILIENSLSDIEELANVILGDISQGLSVQFITQKEVSTRETHCSICGSPYVTSTCTNCGYGVRKNKIKDEIDVRISNGFGDYSFSQNSGGGKVLISLAIRLALSKVLADRCKRCELLVLDEIFGSLDSVNRASVSRAVFNTLSNLLGFRQIFCITHCDLNDQSYRHIKICRKKSGISQIIA